MERLVNPAFAADPEIGLSIGAESRGGIVAMFLLRDFHHEGVVKRRQRLQIEGLGAFVIRNRKSDVVDHQALLRFEELRKFSLAPAACCCGSCPSRYNPARACRRCSRPATRPSTDARSRSRAGPMAA